MAMRDKNECRFDAGHVIVDALILSNIDPAKTTKTLKTTTNPTTTTIAKTKTPSTTTTKTHFHATAVVTILAILLPNPSMQELSQIQPYRPIQPQAQTQTQPLHNNPEQPAIPVHLRQPDQRWLWRNLQSPTMAQVAAVDGLFQHDPTMRTRTSTSSASMVAQEAKTNASLNELAEKLGRLEGDLTTLSQNFLTLQRSVINLEQLQELLVSLLEDIVKPVSTIPFWVWGTGSGIRNLIKCSQYQYSITSRRLFCIQLIKEIPSSALTELFLLFICLFFNLFVNVDVPRRRLGIFPQQ